jgi:hypothetical protein
VASCRKGSSGVTTAPGPILALARRLLPGLRLLSATSGGKPSFVARFESGDGSFEQLTALTQDELAEKLASVLRARGVIVGEEPGRASLDVGKEIVDLAAQGFTDHADTLARELAASRGAQAPTGFAASFNPQGDPLMDGWRVSKNPNHRPGRDR